MTIGKQAVDNSELHQRGARRRKRPGAQVLVGEAALGEVTNGHVARLLRE